MGQNNKKENVLGNNYGRWTVIYDDLPYNQTQGRLIVCQCCCDKKTIKLVKLQVLKDGRSKSCGCLKDEKTIERSTTHGMAGKGRTKIYSLWSHIKSRCNNVNNGSYLDYGGRGIYVCVEWLHDFKPFNDWCISNGWVEGLQLDRIDNGGPYSPDNCRFVTMQENGFNKRVIQKNNNSGYCGVFYRESTGKYSALIRFERKVVFNVNTFKTAKEAAIARDKFIIGNDLPHPLNFNDLRKAL